MGLRDVVNELLDQHSLADTSTAEETNLSTTCVGGKKIDDLNTRLKDLSSRGLLHERVRVGMNGGQLDTLDRTPLVNGLANDVHNTAEGSSANGDLDGGTRVDHLLTADETLGTVHGNGADRVLTQVGGDLEDETTTVEVDNLECVEDRRKVLRLKLNVNDGTNDGFDVTAGALRLRGI